MNRKLTTVLSMMVLVAGLAAAADVDAPEGDVVKTEGEVVMITPAVIHLTIDNTIEEFERTPQSRIEEGLTHGDEVYIWFHQAGTSKVVDRATRKDPDARGDRTEGMMQGQREDSARQQQRDHATMQKQKQKQKHGEEKRSDDTMSYAEYQRQARQSMSERTTLPQTASNVHGLALAGLLLIATGAVLWFRATRS